MVSRPVAARRKRYVESHTSSDRSSRRGGRRLGRISRGRSRTTSAVSRAAGCAGGSATAARASLDRAWLVRILTLVLLCLSVPLGAVRHLPQLVHQPLRL